jgi:hypothetical protein
MPPDAPEGAFGVYGEEGLTRAITRACVDQSMVFDEVKEDICEAVCYVQGPTQVGLWW